MMNQAMLRKMQQMKKDMERTQEEIMNTEFKTTCGPVTVIVMGDRNLKQIIFEEGKYNKSFSETVSIPFFLLITSAISEK